MSSVRKNSGSTNSQTQIKQRYGINCTAIYDEILKQGDVASQPGWQREDNKEYGVTTWTLTENKALGRVGTNGQLVVKISADGGGYDYVKTEDFLDRGHLAFDAAEKIAALYTHDKNAQQKLKHWIQAEKKKFSSNILSQCKLDIGLMLGKGGPEKRTKHFKEKCDIAKRYIQKSIRDITNKFHAITKQPGNRTISMSEILADIKEAEKNVIAERGRPVVIKIGNVGDPHHQIKMVSMQCPLGKKTLPSSMRKGNDPDAKLSNHVLDGSGHIVVDKEGRSQIKFDVMVEGHSSYSPIEEEDELMRRYIALEAVKEKVYATARSIQLSDTDPKLGKDADHPVTVSFATMMLLTPIIGKSIEDNIRGSESEHDQLSVSSRALEGLRHMGQPIAIKVSDGEILHVRVDLSYMSLPANVYGWKQGAIEDPLQKDTNARGFYEYCNNINAKLNEGLPVSPRAADRALEFKPPKDFARLNDKYRELDELLFKYSAFPSPKFREVTTERYKDLKGEILVIEKLAAAEYTRVNEARANKFNGEGETRLRADRQNVINQLLHDPTISPEQRDHLTLESRFIRVQEMFYNKEYANVENAYQFHTLYLLSNEQTGRSIEAFCKSAEDRTGWLRVSMLAHTAFNNTYGHDVDFRNKQEKENYDKFFSSSAHELSASLENTKYNSEARGLQVNGKLTNKYVGMELGKEMAGLAKEVFKHIDFGHVIKMSSLPTNNADLQEYKNDFILIKDKHHFMLYHINENGTPSVCLDLKDKSEIEKATKFMSSLDKIDDKDNGVKYRNLDLRQMETLHAMIEKYKGELPYLNSLESFTPQINQAVVMSEVTSVDVVSVSNENADANLSSSHDVNHHVRSGSDKHNLQVTEMDEFEAYLSAPTSNEYQVPPSSPHQVRDITAPVTNRLHATDILAREVQAQSKTISSRS